jgi:hypothetical protein
MLKVARVLPFRNSCGILPASYHINQSYFSTKSTDAKQSSPPPSSSSKEVKVKPVVTGNNAFTAAPTVSVLGGGLPTVTATLNPYNVTTGGYSLY